MATVKRALLGVLTVGFVTCVYILYGNLEGALFRSPGRSRGVIQGHDSSSQDSSLEVSTEFLIPNPTMAPKTSTAVKRRTPADNPVPTVSESRSESRSRSRSDVESSSEQQQQRGPTELPFIGDTYMSEDIPAQTSCSDGIRGRVPETEFGERFLRYVPVLQWSKHISPEQHQRLSRYSGAHGWGGLDYTTVAETLSVLNSPVNRQMFDDWKTRSSSRIGSISSSNSSSSSSSSSSSISSSISSSSASSCIRCAVVGNGGILKSSKKGQEIDGHHYVFRTNGAVIRGFEEDVGSRTTHYTFSTNTLVNSMKSYKALGFRGPPQSEETRYVFLPDHDRDYLLVKAAATHTGVKRGPDRNQDPTKLFGADVSVEKLKMYHPDFIRYLRNRFLRTNPLKSSFKIYRPSTGAVMLLAALHTCDQVSAYGFMTPDYQNYSDHYYDTSYHRVTFYSNHDLRLEAGLWQQLHRAGLIRLYMHQ